MLTFIREHWWGISLVATATVVFLVKGRTRRPAAAGRGFASTATFTPAQLHPYFGTYLPGTREIRGYIVFSVFITAMSSIIAWTSDASTAVTVLVAVAACGAAVLAIEFDRRSARILGPDRISFESPLRFFSWSVPLDFVQQCDLVPGQPTARLRVHHPGGTYSLPLTIELWGVLSAAAEAAAAHA